MSHNTKPNDASKESHAKDSHDKKHDDVGRVIEVGVEQARKTGRLELTDLGLTEIPLAAFQDTFRVVWLVGNLITTLPGSMMEHWKSIQQLRLNGNLITAIPPEIGKLRSLTMLFVNDNKISQIPDTIHLCKMLQILDCRNNFLKRLPIQLGLLANLYDFQFEGNPLEFPHRAILKSGSTAVIKYLKRFITARKTGKLNLLGCSLHEIPQEVQYVGDKLTELEISDISAGKGLSYPVAMSLCTNLKSIKLNPELKIVFPPQPICSKGLAEILKFLARFSSATRDGVLNMSELQLSELPGKMFDEKHVNVETIRHLILSGNNLNTIPTLISAFQNLEVLDIANNCLMELPSNASSLPNLRKMDVGHNSISEISVTVSRLPSLKELHARNNIITSISEYLVDVFSIQVLNVGANKLSSLPQSFATWTSLRVLLLDHNEFPEIFPSIHQLMDLEHLDYSSNLLLKVSPAVGLLSNLTRLTLNENPFKELPEQVGDLLNLETLEVAGCPKLRHVPDSLSKIARFRCPLAHGVPYFKTLVLDTEYVQSPPVSAISQGNQEVFDFLLSLRLAKSTGKFFYIARQMTHVPFTLCSVHNLSHADLSRNLLTVESFPPDFGRLTNLQALRLDSNNLESIPATFIDLRSLSTLSLRDNPLATLPVESYLLTSLTSLDVGLPGPELRFPPGQISRKGGAAILDFLGRFAVGDAGGWLHLSRLALSRVPEEIVVLGGALAKLSVAHNRLAAIPPSIASLGRLQVLRLHDNCLDGLPDEMAALTALTHLNLEGNRLQSCPPIISSLESLTILNLARNDMAECPLPICALTQLSELNLDHNRIGAMPNRIGRCAHLMQLSMEHNELTKLPASVRDLTRLTCMNLSHNRLTIVPADLGLLKDLEVLNVSGNDLESPPPQILDRGTWAVTRYLQKINQMFVSGHVNLDNCRLTTVPVDVLSYDAVHTLVLTNNCLELVPDGIGRLRHLKSLDLSYNALVELCPAIGGCVALEELNLCHNPKLKRLPAELHRLGRLKYLDVDHEAMVSPPEAVTRRGAAEVVRYFGALVAGLGADGQADLSGFDLREIPREVLHMTGLRALRLAGNRLGAVPGAIARYAGLGVLVLDDNPRVRDLPPTVRHMTALRELSLAGNSLRTVPEEVFRLTLLTRLCLARNDLDGLGGLIGKLGQLRRLDLGRNRLWTLPWPAMVGLRFLQALDLRGNPLTYVSPAVGQLTALKSLDLGDTKLPSLPVDLIDLALLEELSLDNVAIQGPALPVVAQGLGAIRAFLAKVRHT